MLGLDEAQLPHIVFFIGVRLVLWSSLMPPTSAKVCELSQSQPDKWPFGLILLSCVTHCSLQE